MDIYVVQPGDTLYSIADHYGISIDNLLRDNGFDKPLNLVPGQTLVISYPSQTHTVQDGDTLATIANNYGVTLMQLLRNNSFLSDREYIYPGETIVISYNTNGKVTTNGYAYPYINSKTLIKTLPYLTYLSVFNYKISKDSEISAYSDDTEVIQLSKDYGVAPLMLLSALSPTGEPNFETADILQNEELRDRLISNIINILKTTNYYGVNIMLSLINATNQNLYISYLTKVSNSLKDEGYQLFITINPNIKYVDHEISFERIDYSNSQFVNSVTFFQYVWGSNFGPPSPVTSIDLMRHFLDYAVTLAPPDKIATGQPLIGYDWELPYIPGKTIANSLTLDACIRLASDEESIIQYDETSQTPFFRYKHTYFGIPNEHIVWFIDARSINALNQLIVEYGLGGSGIWNIMIFYQQLWTIINSQYEISKVLPPTF